MIRLAVRVQREQAELVLAELLELAPSGVEEVAVGDDAVEYAVYGTPGELPATRDLEAAAGGALVEVSTTEIADDWSERWRSFHKPLVLASRLTVRPPWEPSGATPIDLVIEPGQAFGTGAHTTTRLCLELMLELDAGGSSCGSFLDLGCGSGVLALAAAKLGWDRVVAVDNDLAAITAARVNAEANGVAIDVRGLDLRVEPAPVADTVAANLHGLLLLEWAARLADAAHVPARVIASGLLAGEADRVAAAFAAAGLIESRRRARGEWAALLLERCCPVPPSQRGWRTSRPSELAPAESRAS